MIPVFIRVLSLWMSVSAILLSSVSVFAVDPANNISSEVAQAAKVTQVRVVSRGDDNAQYAISMINLGLKKAGKPFDIAVTSDMLSADKLREELVAGQIDVMWSGTNMDMEEHALPVRICLFKGLLGYRLLMIHKDNQHLFDDVNSFDDLMKFKYGLGKGWVDGDILESNGMEVIRAAYEGLFYMVDGKRIDAFPRAVHEPWGEIANRPDLELAVDSNLMLVYQLPYYLIVAPGRPELAKDLERGLMLALDDGSFDELFLNNAMVKTVMKNANLKSRRVFNVKNPMLPPKTPLDNPKLWVDISQF
jgi:hypothetical protein